LVFLNFSSFFRFIFGPGTGGEGGFSGVTIGRQATTNTGILRCAQDDDSKRGGDTGSGTTKATAEADPYGMTKKASNRKRKSQRKSKARATAKAAAKAAALRMTTQSEAAKAGSQPVF
jgi:hypothetical protein